SATKIITSTGYSNSFQVTVRAEVEQDNPFYHIASFSGTLDLGSNVQVYALNGHGIKNFSPIPPPDLNYYMSIASYYYPGEMTFQDTTLSDILFVNGDVTFKNGVYLKGTIVSTGEIRFQGNVTIEAITVPGDSIFYPAVIAADSTNHGSIVGTPNLIVKGAIYSPNVKFKADTLTGPILGENITFQSNLVVHDLGSEAYYKYPPGFGDPDQFDWDKKIKKGTWIISSY
ncbi:MAG: hypothetical protein ACE5QV_09295, partial [Fidelibacterota bacterium]